MKPVVRAALTALILSGLAAGAWLASRSTAPQRRGPDALITVVGDAARDSLQPAIDLTRMTPEEEVRLGAGIDAVVRASLPVGGDPALEAYLGDLLARLAVGVRRDAIPYTIAVVRNEDVNAFAVAGGHVYVTEGMVAFARSEAELASVIGHEIGHIDLEHCAAGIQVERAAGRVAPGLEGLARLGYEVMLRGFSEEQELQADIQGARLAVATSYDPWAVLDLFGRMMPGEEARARKPTRDPVVEASVLIPEALRRYVATHPPADQRIEAVRRALRADPGLWRGRRLYVGRSNLSARRSAGVDPRPDEWIVREDG